MSRDDPQTPPEAPALVCPQGQTAAAVLVEHIIASMREGVLCIDRHGAVTLVNQALVEILGIPADVLQRSGWADLFIESEANAEFTQVIIDLVLQKRPQQQRQVPYVDPRGRPKDLLVNATLLAHAEGGAEGLSGLLLVVSDVTELAALDRREKELLLQGRKLLQDKVESLDFLARAVAHQIRNPTAVIGGLARRLIAEWGRDFPDSRYLESILAGAERLERIVQSVRAYADFKTPSPRPTSLRAWIAPIAERFRAKAETQGARLVLDGGPGEGGEVTAAIDPASLGEAVSHLLDNAVEAARPSRGEVRLRLTAGPVSAAIVVSDDGPGVSPDDLPHLFDPFFTTKANAVGMSLALAKRIVDEHGGELTADSRPGQGATFTIFIPLSGEKSSAGGNEASGRDARRPGEDLA